ncbi:MAG TPA: hypothetical protein VGF46_00655 [Gaiellales bacterium]|jgi:hypothetical protein
MSAAYHERIAFPDAPQPRFWRGPVRVVMAAWGGALAGFIPGIALDLEPFLGAAIGLGVAALLLAIPVARWRRDDVQIEVADGELRLLQGPRSRRVPLEDIRRVGVRTPAGEGRRPVGYGPVFGRGFRWTFEVPDPALGVVRIDRGRGGLDLDVASARPDELVRALRTANAR